MPFIDLPLSIIAIETLCIVLLLSRLAKKNRNTKSPGNNEQFGDISETLIKDKCFQSPHDAIALFGCNGLLIQANKLFQETFPEPDGLRSPPGIYDFFPEKMWIMLRQGLSGSQTEDQPLKKNFSLGSRHFTLTFSAVNYDTNQQPLTLLFCRKLPPPPPPTPENSSPEDIIWKTILKLTNPNALHSDWHSCFNQVLPELCTALKADDIFILDDASLSGTLPSVHCNKQDSKYNYDWVLSVPVWINLLGKGQIVQNHAENFDPEQLILLQQEGIKTLLLIPLRIGNELHGIIGLTRTKKVKLFQQQQINSLLFIANILSMAISNQQDRSERDRLVTVVEQSSDCIIIINTSGTVLYANPACEAVTGFTPQEIVGNSIKRLYTPAVRKKLWSDLRKPLKKGEPWSGQFDNFRKDRSIYQEEMQISPVYDQEGRVANQVIIKRDITEDKRLESIAEAANLMDNIGFIFSSIRHELGNPINSIKVSLSILESNLETYDTEAISRFIHRGLSDIGRVEYLLKTLRNFSIFERPDIKKTNMQALLDKLIQLTEKDLAKRYIMLALDLPQAPLHGLVDPRAFLQVLLNLTTNAVAALDETENKTITISLIQKQKNQITFIFEDNGCGMEEDTVRNLFRPFFTTKAEGTGLGLVIVKKMLAKMNCSITASSQKGQGTRMEIIIPTV